MSLPLGILICGALIEFTHLFATNAAPAAPPAAAALTPAVRHHQLIVWTSTDAEVARNVVFLYAENCVKLKWMDTVRVLVWGPSQKIFLGDPELQRLAKSAKAAGVEVVACQACSDIYGITDQLTKVGLDVAPSGQMFVDVQKAGWHVVTF